MDVMLNPEADGAVRSSLKVTTSLEDLFPAASVAKTLTEMIPSERFVKSVSVSLIISSVPDADAISLVTIPVSSSRNSAVI